MNDVGVSFTYRAGETVKLRFTARDSDRQIADITGSTPSFVLGREGEDPVASTAEATATAALLVPGEGTYVVTIEAEVTAPLSGTYLFESWLEDVSDGKSNPAHGYITFKRSLVTE